MPGERQKHKDNDTDQKMLNSVQSFNIVNTHVLKKYMCLVLKSGLKVSNGNFFKPLSDMHLLTLLTKS